MRCTTHRWIAALDPCLGVCANGCGASRPAPLPHVCTTFDQLTQAMKKCVACGRVFVQVDPDDLPDEPSPEGDQ